VAITIGKPEIGLAGWQADNTKDTANTQWSTNNCKDFIIIAQ
jgi:hypothetical protein